jgi:Family of unknown function (DUF6309)
MRVLGDVQFEEVMACFERENAESTSRNWTVDRLREADKNGAGTWTLVILSRQDVLDIVLPHHRRCGPEVVPENGLTVSAASERVRGLTKETGTCWDNIASHKDRDFSQTHIFLEAENGILKHLDGLHRLLAWKLFKKQEEPMAYVVHVGRTSLTAGPNPKHITPGTDFEPNFGAPLQLFDEGGYTVIAAKFRGHPHVRLAQKCEDSPAKPGCRSGWHVVPEFLEIPLLHILLDELSKDPRHATEEGRARRESILKQIDFFHGQKRDAAR